MITKFFLGSLFITTSFALSAMDGKQKLNFNDVTLKGLNNFALHGDVDQLTPRSCESLEKRLKELGINPNSNAHIALVLQRAKNNLIITDNLIPVFVLLVKRNISEQMRGIQNNISISIAPHDNK